MAENVKADTVPLPEVLEIDPDNLPSRKIAEDLGAHPAGEASIIEEAGEQFPNQKLDVNFE